MRNIFILFLVLFSSTTLAVTGNGTGSQTQVTGGGTGAETQVTGNGTGSSTQVTGNGTGTEVTGGGTGAESVGIDACMTGSFYDPDNPGQGINVEVLPEAIVVYFYGADGDWFIFQGDENGLDMYQPRGDGSVEKVGNGYFIPVDNDIVDFGFDMLLDVRDVSFERPIPWCLRSDCEQNFVYARLTQPIPCAADSETEVTGGGTGKPEVTGGGTGKEITGNGTGKEVTGGGTGSSVQVTGGGTGRE